MITILAHRYKRVCDDTLLSATLNHKPLPHTTRPIRQIRHHNEQPFKELRLKIVRVNTEGQAEKQDIGGYFIDSLNPTKPINKRFKSNIGLLGLVNRRRHFTRKEDRWE